MGQVFRCPGEKEKFMPSILNMTRNASGQKIVWSPFCWKWWLLWIQVSAQSHIRIRICPLTSIPRWGIWATWRHYLLQLENAILLPPKITELQLENEITELSEKLRLNKALTSWSLNVDHIFGILVSSIKPIHAWVLFLAYLDNCNFQFLPLSKFPGIFACCLGNNATETSWGKSDLERIRATPEQHLSFKKSKWHCKLMLSFNWPLLEWIH